MMAIIAVAFGVVLPLGILSGYLPTRNIDTSAYNVVAAKQGYEIRRYEPFIVA